MKRFLWFLWAWASLLPAAAQHLRWERPLDFAATSATAGYDLFAYAKVLSGGNYLVHGAGSTGYGYPFMMAQYRPDGTPVWQKMGRLLGTLEQDVLPLGPAGYLLTASVKDYQVLPSPNRLFFQRIRANGDTLPGRLYPRSLLQGSPVRMVADGDSVRVLSMSLPVVNGQATANCRFALLAADTAGTVGALRVYPNPAPGVAYPCDLVRTPRGGWLLAGEFSPGPFIRPYLVEVDARGRLLRQRTPVLFPGGTNQRVNRVFNNLVRLADGSGYVLSGFHETSPTFGAPRWGFLAKLDTALNVVWTYRHPPQATAQLLPTRVRELPDGTLGWLVGDAATATTANANAYYLVHVSAAGQLLGQRRVASAACAQLTLYDWQPLPGGGALVAGGFATCAATGSAFAAYTARLDSATALAAARPTAAGGGSLFPNPAPGDATWQGRVPAGARLAVLVLCDLLGRRVLTVPLPAPGGAVAGGVVAGAEVNQAVPLLSLPNGQYAYCLFIGGQAVGPPRKLVVLH